jgi:hypothetical protein
MPQQRLMVKFRAAGILRKKSMRLKLTCIFFFFHVYHFFMLLCNIQFLWKVYSHNGNNYKILAFTQYAEVRVPVYYYLHTQPGGIGYPPGIKKALLHTEWTQHLPKRSSSSSDVYKNVQKKKNINCA